MNARYHIPFEALFVAIAVSAAVCPQASASLPSQLATLTDWYQAMDSANGKSVALFPNDISYLTPDKDSISPIYNVWPAWKTVEAGGHRWPIRVAKADSYFISVSLNGAAQSTLQVTVGAQSLKFTLPHTGVNKYQIGKIDIPAGEATLTLSLLNGSANLANVELVPASAKPAIDASIKASQSRVSWMKDAPVGVFLQWGEWGVHANGAHSPWPGAYKNMNWSNFAQKIKDTGADYVIWSINWDDYYVAAPIAAIDAVLPGRTTTAFGGHDYLMDIVNELTARGIKVVFYYHAGWDQLSWWKPNYVNDLPGGNNARKEKFMNRWMNIISEISNRYGEKLDGWMFDHTNSYFPGPFKMMTEVARQGNPQRLITFNSYQSPFYTPAFTSFADYYMGETYTADAAKAGPFDVPVDIVDGRFTSGPFEGYQAFGCFIAETGGSYGGWGISRNAGGIIPTIGPRSHQDWFDKVGVQAAVTKQSMAYTVQMWENGDMNQATLDYIRSAASLGHASKTTVEHADAAISYSGTGWARKGDRHTTSIKGDVVRFAFAGTGVDYLATVGPADGKADIYIDDVLQTTVNLARPDQMARQVAYSNTSLKPGKHVLKIVNASAAPLPVEAFQVYAALKGKIINDSDGAIVYTKFDQSVGRPEKNHQGDLHLAKDNGASFEYTFHGSEIAYVGEKGPAYGIVDVYLDGALQASINAHAAEAGKVRQLLFRKANLGMGAHTLKVVKRSGELAALDYLVVNPYYKITNLANGLVLNGGGGVDGYAATEWSDVPGANLQWEFIDQRNGYFKIRNKADGKMLRGGGSAGRAVVAQWTDEAAASQEWKLLVQGNGQVRLQNRASGNTLVGGASTPGVAVTEVVNASAAASEWLIAPVDD